MAIRQKLELTWIGKDQRPRLEPRILLEDPSRSYHAKQRAGEHCHTHIVPRRQKVIDGQNPVGVMQATGWQGGGFRDYEFAPTLLVCCAAYRGVTAAQAAEVAAQDDLFGGGAA